MKFGLGLYGNILTQDNFRFAKQAGATHIVAHVVGHFGKPANISTANKLPGFGVSYPGGDIWTYEGMRDLRKAINAEGWSWRRSRTSSRRTGTTCCSTARARSSRWST